MKSIKSEYGLCADNDIIICASSRTCCVEVCERKIAVHVSMSVMMICAGVDRLVSGTEKRCV